jgi:hypothetical protein
MFLFIFPTLANSKTSHEINWESGVNIKVVKSWAKSLSKVSNIQSTTYIRKKIGGEDNLHRSGHRDVIVWVPETTDLSKNFVLILWFHGHWGYVPHRTFEDRTLKQLVPLATSKNFVLVIPEMPWSVHTSTPTKRNGDLWQKPGEFLQFIDQVHSILRRHAGASVLGNIDHRIVGHSAGGSTIKRLGITGDLCRLSPSMVVWSDSSYGSWLNLAWNGCLKDHPNIQVKVFVAKGDTPYRRAKMFISQFKEKPKNLKLFTMRKPKWSHKLIGNKIVNISQLLQ